MFFNLLQQGGPFFMYPLVVLLILILVFIVQVLLKKGSFEKSVSLIASLALFAIVWGFLGQIIGLISAFDAIEEAGEISLAMLAGGLKVSFLAPSFGMFVFLIGRFGIIVLTWMKKE